jgi:hypothetical protein
VKALALVLGSLLIIAGVTGCSNPVDYKAAVCSSYKDLRSNEMNPDSQTDRRSIVAALSASLTVWKQQNGDRQNLYWKISDYLDVTNQVESAVASLGPGAEDEDYQNFKNADLARTTWEDKNIKSLESSCDLESTFIHSLKVTGGCWSWSRELPYLQKKDGGKWLTWQLLKVKKTAGCRDANGHPYGVETSNIWRGTADDGAKWRIVWKAFPGETFSSGRTRYTSCASRVPATTLEVWFDYDCLNP